MNSWKNSFIKKIIFGNKFLQTNEKNDKKQIFEVQLKFNLDILELLMKFNILDETTLNLHFIHIIPRLVHSFSASLRSKRREKSPEAFLVVSFSAIKAWSLTSLNYCILEFRIKNWLPSSSSYKARIAPATR